MVETEKPENQSPPSLPERSALVKGKSSALLKVKSSGPSRVSAAYGPLIKVNRRQKAILPPHQPEAEDFLETQNEELEDSEEEEQQHIIETEVEIDERYMPIRHGEYQLDDSEFDEMDDQFEATENWNSQVK